MKTFEIPVWFTLRAHDQNDAWEKIVRLMKYHERLDQLPEYIVEEPVLVNESKKLSV